MNILAIVLPIFLVVPFIIWWFGKTLSLRWLPKLMYSVGKGLWKVIATIFHLVAAIIIGFGKATKFRKR